MSEAPTVAVDHRPDPRASCGGLGGHERHEADPGQEMEHMRSAGIVAYGGPVQRLELPEPKISDPHQLLIAVHAAGVGNWDDIVRTGGWDVGGRPPRALGVEAAGMVS